MELAVNESQTCRAGLNPALAKFGMSPIHPEIFRVGKISRGLTDSGTVGQPSNIVSNKTLVQLLNGYLGDLYNLAVVKCNIAVDSKSGVVNVSIIFYKYIQRARLVKSRRLILLLAAGAFGAKPPIYYVRQSQGFIVPAAIVRKLEIVLQDLFGAIFNLQFFNISQLAELAPNKINQRVIQSLEYFVQSKVAENSVNRRFGLNESRLEKSGINPIALRDSYRAYKPFSNIAYFLDLLMIMLYTSVYTTSNLFADVLARGLLRNMKRHKQFLSAVATILTHLRSFENGPYRPLDWCIGLHGKIGSGTVRSRSHYIKTGFLPLQTISFPIDYTYRSVDTKFGSIGIKIGLHRHTN